MKDIIKKIAKENDTTAREVREEMQKAIAEGSRTIIAEKSPFWSKYPFVAWNT